MNRYTKTILIVSGLLSAGALLPWALNQHLTLRQYNIQTKKLRRPVRLILLADLHSCCYGPQQQALLQMIYDRHPDAVLFAGDIIDDLKDPRPAIQLLRAAAKRYPCFAVTGNHEYYGGRAQQRKQLIRQCGVVLLEGDSQMLQICNDPLSICGVDDPNGGADAFRSQLQSAAPVDPSIYTILLTHRPEYIHDYLPLGFDLITAGHTHGGQWRLPGLQRGLMTPSQGLFPKYTGGRYDFGNQTMLISRGLQNDCVVPRLFNPPEVVCIDLVPEKL